MSDTLLRPLSPAQKKVASLVAKGYDYTQIGSSLGISPSTARHHVERIADRLASEDRLPPYRKVMRWVLSSPALQVTHQA